VIITSNNEKELPDAFLRRCFFHYIKFPDRDTMQQIVDVHFRIKQELLAQALQTFYEVREVPGLKKKPSTSELLDWLKLLMAEDIPPGAAQPGQGHRAAAARRAAEERAGRAPVRAPGLHVADQPMNTILPTTLELHGVRLEPLGAHHADGLRAAAATARCGSCASPRCRNRTRWTPTSTRPSSSALPGWRLP
jgi:MoxR-like ATPase